MLRADIESLNETERELLDESFQPERTARQVWTIVVSAVVAAATVIAFGEHGLSAPWFAAVTCCVLVIGLVEKVVYQHKMLQYEMLLRKLVHRVEELEQVPLTPDHGVPSSTVRQSACRA